VNFSSQYGQLMAVK